VALQMPCDILRGFTLSLPHTGKSKEDIAREILSYFLRNPQATDNLLGIARWRLLEESVHRSVRETEAVLQWLIAQGYLRELHPEGSEHLFQLEPAKREEAQRFLDAQGSKKKKVVKRSNPS